MEQCIQYVHHVTGNVLLGSTHLFGRLQTPPTYKYSKAHKCFLLIRFEELITPVNRASQSLLACGQVACAAGQESQAAAQACKQFVRSKHIAARGGEFDGEWKPVEPDTNRGDSGSIRRCQLKLFSYPLRSLDKQGNCRIPPYCVYGGQLEVRHRQGRHEKFLLTGQIEDAPTCHQQFERGAAVRSAFNAGAASSTCSKLSRTSSNCFSRR